MSNIAKLRQARRRLQLDAKLTASETAAVVKLIDEVCALRDAARARLLTVLERRAEDLVGEPSFHGHHFD